MCMLALLVTMHQVSAASQVFLEFEYAFWESKVPADTGQFGVTLGEGAAERGMASTVWNFKPFNGAPILCALLIGSAAERMAALSDAEVEATALDALRAVWGADGVPQVVRACCARWGEDEFATGSYSYVAVGGSGDSYDLLARPLGRSVLFCGEHTTKEHLDTVGGAMRTGVREVRHCLRLHLVRLMLCCTLANRIYPLPRLPLVAAQDAGNRFHSCSQDIDCVC